MQLKDGDKIRLAPGATELAEYTEWDHEALYVNPKGNHWMASITISAARLKIQQAYNGKRRMNRAWMRKQCAMFLDSIAPGWQIVRSKKS